jgi:hypothetical protein
MGPTTPVPTTVFEPVHNASIGSAKAVQAVVLVEFHTKEDVAVEETVSGSCDAVAKFVPIRRSTAIGGGGTAFTMSVSVIFFVVLADVAVTVTVLVPGVSESGVPIVSVVPHVGVQVNVENVDVAPAGNPDIPKVMACGLVEVVVPVIVTLPCWPWVSVMSPLLLKAKVNGAGGWVIAKETESFTVLDVPLQVSV